MAPPRVDLSFFSTAVLDNGAAISMISSSLVRQLCGPQEELEGSIDPSDTNGAVLITVDQRMDDEIRNFINAGWSPELKHPQSILDKRAMQLLQQQPRRSGDRFELGLLWREDQHEFPDQEIRGAPLQVIRT